MYLFCLLYTCLCVQDMCICIILRCWVHPRFQYMYVALGCKLLVTFWALTYILVKLDDPLSHITCFMPVH